jgi:hypothetical protein
LERARLRDTDEVAGVPMRALRAEHTNRSAAGVRAAITGICAFDSPHAFVSLKKPMNGKEGLSP